MSRRCHPAFTAALVPLIISHAAEAPSQSAEAPSKAADFSPGTPDLTSYSQLWTRSIFTSHEPTTPQPREPQQPPDWASDFELSGWTRVDDSLTVYLTRLSSGTTLILQENEPEAPNSPRLDTISGEETILDGKVRISLNGQSAWVSLNPAASAHIPPLVSMTKPGATGSDTVPHEDVIPPTTIDSRAARLNGPVILDAAATYETVLTPPQQPALSAVDRLRQRREKLIRDFPRRSQPTPTN